jgi:cysteine desulfurase
MPNGEAPIYLDHNATTPLAPEVLAAMLPILRRHHGNPSSSHVYGRQAAAAVATARESVAGLVGCRPDEVVFTGGGSEANNLAIRGVAAARPDRSHIVTTAIEHPATAEPCALLERQGHSVSRIAVRPDGTIDLAAAAAMLDDDTALVSVIHAHNETGIVQPVGGLAALARQRGAVVHVDAAQSLGKIPVSLDELAADLISIAGHKLYGPKGVGALIVRRGTPLEPLLVGGGQERGLRPGTENVAGIVGLAAACALAGRDLADEGRRLRGLRDDLLARLAAGIPGLGLNGGDLVERLPNTLSVRFPGVHGSDLLAATPGIAASTGSACHAGHDTPPAVLTAMGIAADDALGTVRLSLGRDTTAAAVAVAAEQLAAAWSNRRSRPTAAVQIR